MFNHAPEGYVCPFCQIVQRLSNAQAAAAAGDLVYHDAVITAFISSHQWPNNPGNTLIIPNAHFENIFELPASLATQIHALAQKIALAMKTVYHCDGISTRQHNEPAGSQDVWHYHLHVTPRFVNDNFYLTMKQIAPMPAEARAELARQLRAHLGNGKLI